MCMLVGGGGVRSTGNIYGHKIFVFIGLKHLEHLLSCFQISKDPDVRLEALFVVGEEMPVQVRHILA